MNEKDNQFLVELSRTIRERPELFAEGGRWIDEHYSRRALRKRRALQVRARRGSYAEELERAKNEAIRQAEDSGKRLLPTQIRPDSIEAMLVGVETYYRAVHDSLTDPLDWPYRRHGPPTERRWQRHCRVKGLDPARWSHGFDRPDLLGRPISLPLRRFSNAISWAIGGEGSGRPDALAEFNAVLIVVWLLFDRAAHQIRPLLCEFQGLPWEPWSEVGGELFQGRGLQADRLPSLLPVARDAWAQVSITLSDSGSTASRRTNSVEPEKACALPDESSAELDASATARRIGKSRVLHDGERRALESVAWLQERFPNLQIRRQQYEMLYRARSECPAYTGVKLPSHATWERYIRSAVRKAESGPS